MYPFATDKTAEPVFVAKREKVRVYVVKDTHFYGYSVFRNDEDGTYDNFGSQPTRAEAELFATKMAEKYSVVKDFLGFDTHIGDYIFYGASTHVLYGPYPFGRMGKVTQINPDGTVTIVTVAQGYDDDEGLEGPIRVIEDFVRLTMEQVQQKIGFSAGDTVRLALDAQENHRCPEGREDNFTATVRSISDIGEVHLREDLHGCRWWQIGELILVQKGGK